MLVSQLETSIRRCVSANRLGPYYKTPDPLTRGAFLFDPDHENALARYVWNMALCETLYPALGSLEIVFRNAVHISLTAHHGSANWMQNNGVVVRAQEQNMVAKAVRSLTARRRSVTPDELVAELNFGFWTALLVGAYQTQVVLPLFQRELRRLPLTVRQPRPLQRAFDDFRFLRNRVFHYEPIWYRADLDQQHKDILAYIGHINAEKQQLTLLLDRFDQVYDNGNGWQHWRTEIAQKVL